MVTMQGVLKKFDQKYIWIEAESKNSKKIEIKIPRHTLKNLDGYVTGRAVLMVDVSIDDIARLNPDQFR